MDISLHIQSGEHCAESLRDRFTLKAAAKVCLDRLAERSCESFAGHTAPDQFAGTADLQAWLARLNEQPSAADLVHAVEANLLDRPMRDWAPARRLAESREKAELDLTFRMHQEHTERMADAARRRKREQDDLHVLAEAERARRTSAQTADAAQSEASSKQAGDAAQPVKVLAPNADEAKAQSEPRHASEYKKRAPAVLRDDLRRTNFLDGVIQGAQQAGKEFVPGRDCTAADIVRALQNEAIGIIAPDADRDTMGDAIRAYYSTYHWKARKTAENTPKLLVSYYLSTQNLSRQAGNEAAAKARKAIKRV